MDNITLYIDADELLKHKFKSASERMDLSVAYMSGWNDAIDSIYENAPIIEAEPVRHGKWIHTGFMEVKCNNCGNVFHELEDTNYCPNCGAKMEEVEEFYSRVKMLKEKLMRLLRN